MRAKSLSIDMDAERPGGPTKSGSRAFTSLPLSTPASTWDLGLSP